MQIIKSVISRCTCMKRHDFEIPKAAKRLCKSAERVSFSTFQANQSRNENVSFENLISVWFISEKFPSQAFVSHMQISRPRLTPFALHLSAQSTLRAYVFQKTTEKRDFFEQLVANTKKNCLFNTQTHIYCKKFYFNYILAPFGEKWAKSQYMYVSGFFFFNWKSRRERV